MATEGLLPYIKEEKEVPFSPSEIEPTPFYLAPSDLDIDKFEKEYWTNKNIKTK